MVVFSIVLHNTYYILHLKQNIMKKILFPIGMALLFLCLSFCTFVINNTQSGYSATHPNPVNKNSDALLMGFAILQNEKREIKRDLGSRKTKRKRKRF
jgi:hypothetical protein